MRLPDSIRRPLARWRRTACEAIRIDRYSRPALHSIDRKIERHLDFDSGFFVEAGANDGHQQSNTYYLEKFRGWTGVLIEPIPELAVECRKNRRGPVVQVALAAREIPGAVVRIHFAGLMSVSDEAIGDAAKTAAHVASGLSVQRLPKGYTVDVPRHTLSTVLDDIHVSREIDLLSLDVEGAEVAALQGIDFARHAPRYICVEARHHAAIQSLLHTRYCVAEVLTDLDGYQDLLYRRV